MASNLISIADQFTSSGCQSFAPKKSHVINCCRKISSQIFVWNAYSYLYDVILFLYFSPTTSSFKMSQEIISFELPHTQRESRSLLCDNVSLLPCKIQYNGPAPVSLYFQPELVDSNNIPLSSIAVLNATNTTLDESRPLGAVVDNSSSESQYYTSALRGRQMTGRKIKMPTDTVGIVLTDGTENVLVNKSMGTKVKKTSTLVNPVVFDANASIVKLENKFNSFYLWNKDQNQYDNNYIANAVETYLPISAALHGYDEFEEKE